MRAGIAIAEVIKEFMGKLEDDVSGRSLHSMVTLVSVAIKSVDEFYLDEVSACLKAITGRERLRIDPRAGDMYERATCTALLYELEYQLKERRKALEKAHGRITGY